MHDSGGHDYITFGWIATIIGLLLFGALGQSYSTSKHQSSYYAQRCAQQYPDSPLAASRIHPSSGEPEAQPADNSQKPQPDWCDLAAQQAVAEDTAGMHWASWAGVVFTVIGIFFIWRTLNANTEAVEQARVANQIARDANEAQLRAYLLVKTIFADFIFNPTTAEITGITIKLVVRNGGQTPAMNVGHSIRLSETLLGDPPEDMSQAKSVPVTIDMQLHRAADVGPGDEIVVIDQTIPIKMFGSFERKYGLSCNLNCHLQYKPVVSNDVKQLILNYWIRRDGNKPRLRVSRSGPNETT